MGTIDWENLAHQIGSGDCGGDQFAKEALANLLWEVELQAAVEHYLKSKPGSELIRSVLWLLRPKAAADYCYSIWRSDRPLKDRISSVELARAIARPEMVSWVAEILKDPEPSMQCCGASLLEQLIYQELVQIEDVQELIQMVKEHSNADVRTFGELIRGIKT